MGKKKSERKARKLARKYGEAQSKRIDWNINPPRFELSENVKFEEVETEDVVYHGENLTEEKVEEIVDRFVDTVKEGSVVGHTSTGAEIIAQADGTSFDEEGYPNDDQRADGEQVFDHSVYSERPQRWSTEEMKSTGDWLVVDSYTGLIALCGEQSTAVRIMENLVTGREGVGQYVWRERESMAEVIVSVMTESDQYWAIYDDDRGAAVFDRFARLVHPFGSEDIDVAARMARDFSRDPNELAECAEDDERHWFTVAEWMAGDPDIIPESSVDEAAAAPLPDERRPVRVLLISSRGWAWKGIVRELLQTYWNGLDNPPMTILTSGMPHGAESVAYEFVEAGVHGITHEVIPDNMILPDTVDYAFAFISNKSEGASNVVDRLRVLEIPFHLVEETSAVIPDRWAGR